MARQEELKIGRLAVTWSFQERGLHLACDGTEVAPADVERHIDSPGPSCLVISSFGTAFTTTSATLPSGTIAPDEEGTCRARMALQVAAHLGLAPDHHVEHLLRLDELADLWSPG